MKNKKGLTVFIIFLIVIILLGSANIILSTFGITNSNTETIKQKDMEKSNWGYIASVKISGVIEESNEFYNQAWLLNIINKLKNDSSNVALALFIDSPGGNVYQSDEIFLALKDYKESKKPLYVYMGQMAASGAYYISVASDKIYANRNTLTGSIGVIAGHSIDATEFLSKIGIKSTTIHSGKNKTMMNYDEPLTEEQIKMISGFVETVYLSFDSDNAGQNATIRAIYMCRQFDLPVKIIQLKGGKDPAEILLNFGKENLTAQVNSAILDSDYLLNRIGAMYPVDTPEGKIQAALEFFPYIDSLKSEIQKESSLDQLSQAFNLKPEAVRRDFLNRNQARDRIKIRSNNEKVEQNVPISLNAELRGLIAVTADLSQFEILRSSLSEDDLKNPHAKQLFRILEDCYQKKTFSEIDILAACEGTGLAQLITQVISSDVYQKEKVTAVVQDTIKLIKKNKIEEQRDELLKRIRNFIVATEDDKILLDNMIKQKMELDKQVQSLIN